MKKAAITGAFSYSGKYIAEILMNRGWGIHNLTGHPNRPHPFPADSLKTFQLKFPEFNG